MWASTLLSPYLHPKLSSLYSKLYKSPCQCRVCIGLYTLSSRWGLCMGCCIMKGVSKQCMVRLRLTVESAAALKIQDKIEGKYDENMQNINGQFRNEMYKRAENMRPQLDGTFNISDDSDSDLHSYLDLTGANITAYRMRGQKQRHEVNERANTNRCSALKEYTKPNTKVKIQRQKVQDAEDIDIDKIVKGNKPKDDRNSANKIEKQYKEKEAKRLALEKAKRIQMQKDMKDKEVKRFAIEKAQIEALIEKHRPHTPKTPDKVSTSGTGKNAKVDGQEGIKKGKPPHKKATKYSQIKKSHKKSAKKLKMLKKAIWIHYWVIRWLILQQVQKRQKKKGK